MDEQFVLRVPPSVAERLNLILSENASSSEDKSLDLEFFEDGRTGTFVLGNERFPASLLDLPCVVESYKTYDDNALVKTSDIDDFGQRVRRSFSGCGGIQTWSKPSNEGCSEAKIPKGAGSKSGACTTC